MQTNRPFVLHTSLLSVLAIGFSAVVHMPYRLLYNSSESAPIGWYGVMPADRIQVNDMVVAWLPENAAVIASQRGYLPRNVPLLKRVGATVGQRICITHGNVLVDESIVAHTRARDGAGRPLTSWSQCRPLAVDELFLLSATSDASFDSRYFGPIHRSTIIGRAVPLWTW